MRLRYWNSGGTGESYDITAQVFNADAVKHLIGRHGEIVLGAGITYGHLDKANRINHTLPNLGFILPGEVSRYGPSVFAEGYCPLWVLGATKVGSVGRARTTWLMSSSDLPHLTIDNADIISELASGLELRRTFGSQGQRHWHLAVLREGQRWELSNSYSDPAFTGVNINSGIAW